MKNDKKADPAFHDLVHVRHPFERARVFTPVRGLSMTHQSHKDICDINHIVRRFAQTGMLPPSRKEPQYADISEYPANLDEKIELSRATLDKAGRASEAQKAAQVKAAQQKQLETEKELERLKQIEAEVKASQGKS